MQDYYSDLGIYIKTKTSPQLFYLPVEHNDKTLELLKNSSKETEGIVFILMQYSICVPELLNYESL